MTSWFQIWLSFIKDRKLIYLAGILSLFLTDIMQVLMIELLGIIIDFFTETPIPQYLIRENKLKTFEFICILFVINRILMTLGRVGWRLTMARQTWHSSGHLKKEVWSHARFFSKDSFSLMFTKGALMNLSASDSMIAARIFGFCLVGAFDSILLGSFTIVCMAFINLKMTILVLICVIPMPFFIKKTADKEGELHEIAQKKLTELNDKASQATTTIRLQRITQTGSYWNNILVHFADGYRIARLNARKVSLMFIPLFMGSNLFASIVLFSYGIYLVYHNEMSVGKFVAYQGLIGTLQGPLMEAGYIVTEWKEGRVSLSRLVDLMNNEKDEFLFADGDEVESIDTAFNVRDMSFQFNDSSSKLFNNFNLEIKRGDRLGITGYIGTGKTTFIEMLAGINRGYEGTIEFMGKDIKSYSHESLRDNIFVVSQRPFLFADTVRNNLLLNIEKSDEEIWDALRVAGVDEDIRALEDGLETELGEWGINLSGGQKQRLTLARVLLRKPKILIIDDALSAVDTTTEEQILNELNRSLSDITIIWIAHRESTLRHCNRIIDFGRE